MGWDEDWVEVRGVGIDWDGFDGEGRCVMERSGVWWCRWGGVECGGIRRDGGSRITWDDD